MVAQVMPHLKVTHTFFTFIFPPFPFFSLKKLSCTEQGERHLLVWSFAIVSINGEPATLDRADHKVMFDSLDMRKCLTGLHRIISGK